MWNRFVSSALVYPYLVAGVIAAIYLGFKISNQILLPLLNIAVSYPVMYSLLGSSQRKKAVAAMLFWAVCMGVFTVLACVHFPEEAAKSIFHGKKYAQEMLEWIKTGIGAEGNPLQFVPQHLLHLAIFVVLSIFTASSVSLIMGAVLMNYMSFYVGTLVQSATDPVLAVWMGWHPWSILRVISFVILGVLLAEPVICRIKKKDYDYTGARPLLWSAITGLCLDILIKSILAPWWGLKLREIVP